ncbi:hypothetical protein [Aeromonas hydrophila]|uniref:hypothetical protein n=1 Tax=Aeromonas hydrophila TaxID=644 RepID=UPI001314291B|nr:hypothetical protein [Aeromonas hydrophila]
MNVSLHNGDCLAVLVTMADSSVDCYEIAERRVAAAYPIYPNFIVKHERTLTITQEAA